MLLVTLAPPLVQITSSPDITQSSRTLKQNKDLNQWCGSTLQWQMIVLHTVSLGLVFLRGWLFEEVGVVFIYYSDC